MQISAGPVTLIPYAQEIMIVKTPEAYQSQPRDIHVNRLLLYVCLDLIADCASVVSNKNRSLKPDWLICSNNQSGFRNRRQLMCNPRYALTSFPQNLFIKYSYFTCACYIKVSHCNNQQYKYCHYYFISV